MPHLNPQIIREIQVKGTEYRSLVNRTLVISPWINDDKLQSKRQDAMDAINRFELELLRFLPKTAV